MFLAGFQAAQPEFVVAHEVLDRAPTAVSATYNFQCGEYSATILVVVPQARTQSGVRVSGQPSALAFLNGVSVGDVRNAQLLEAMMSVAILPQISPHCSEGRPKVYFSWQDRSAVWRFIEDEEEH